MKTFFIDINDALKKGLRPRIDAPTEGKFLTAAKNVKPSPIGITHIPRYIRSFATINVDADILSCYNGMYIAADTTIYTYSNGTLLSVLSGIPAGNRWSCADFRGYAVFTNGATNVIATMFGILSIDAGVKLPISAAVCAFRGRLIMGGFSNTSSGEISYGQANMVAWTEIGSLSFPATTNLATSRKNTGGFMPMPWKGRIYAVLPLGKAVIVYGDKGIAAMVMASVGDTHTFGLKHLSNIGLYGQSAVVSTGTETDAKLHYFVRADGKLFSLDASMELKELDYAEFLSGAGTIITTGLAGGAWLADGSHLANGTLTSIADPIRLSYDSQREELFIGRPNTTYILTKFGLGSMDGAISSAHYDSTEGLIMHSKTTLAQAEIEFCSDIITTNNFGSKSLEFISLNYLSPDRIAVAIETRKNPWDEFTLSPWKFLNANSIVKFSRLSIEFKIRIRVSNYTTFNLTNMRLAFQFRDRRARRGVSIDRFGG